MSAARRRTVLVLGFGNPGRGDDGIGPALAARIAAAEIPGVRVETGYQLEVEDATLVAEHDDVVFVDASRDAAAPFEFRPVEAPALVGAATGGGAEFTTHFLAPGALLGIARDVFGAVRTGFVLAVRGEEFDVFAERLSPAAAANLEAAAGFLERTLRRGLPGAPDTEG